MSTRWFQSSPFEKRVAKNLLGRFIGGRGAHRSEIGRNIIDPVTMLGDREGIARLESPIRYGDVVNLYAVEALEVFDIPITPADRELAMVRRDIFKAKYDVAAFATTDE